MNWKLNSITEENQNYLYKNYLEVNKTVMRYCTDGEKNIIHWHILKGYNIPFT